MVSISSNAVTASIQLVKSVCSFALGGRLNLFVVTYARGHLVSRICGGDTFRLSR